MTTTVTNTKTIYKILYTKHNAYKEEEETIGIKP